jgi:hypothetical protein
MHDDWMYGIPIGYNPPEDRINRASDSYSDPFAWERIQEEPTLDARMVMSEVMSDARRMAAAICRKGCCDVITIFGINNGGRYLPDSFVEYYRCP